MVQEFSFKQKKAEKLEGLLPTLPNLYGLDIRFRYTERKLKEEKERRRATSKVQPGLSGQQSPNAEDGEDYNQFDHPPANRHGKFQMLKGKK